MGSPSAYLMGSCSVISRKFRLCAATEAFSALNLSLKDLLA